MFVRALIILALTAMSGCNREPDAPTAEESRQLDEAANLLDQAPANLERIDDSALPPANQSAPAERP